MDRDNSHKPKQSAGLIQAPEAWPSSFPKGIGFTTIRYLRSCEGFYEAKAGDYDAAVRVVPQCLHFKKLVHIWGSYQDVIVVPVISQKPSNNKIPLALADIIGFEVLPTIYCESCIGYYQRKQTQWKRQ